MNWETDLDSIMASKTLRTMYEQGLQAGYARAIKEARDRAVEEGRREALEHMLSGLLKRQLCRDLTPQEQQILGTRAASLDVQQACQLVLLGPDALQARLLGPDAE